MVRLGMATGALFALGLLVFEPAPATAHEHVCKPRKVTGSDLVWLRKKATEVAAGRKLDWSTAHPCGTEEHLVSIVDATPVQHSDGTELHGAAWCERDNVKWECKWVQFRLLTVQVRTAGGQRPVTLRLEGSVEAGLASRIIQHAVDNAPQLQLRQECGGGTANSDGAELDLESFRRDLAFAGPETFARIDDFNGTYAVEINNRYLEYRVPDAAPASFEFTCWGPMRWMG